MTYIREIGDGEATGRLRELFDAAIRRAGRVYNIVRCMSLAPEQIEASMGLYQVLMFRPSGLSRAEREMIATVVSAANRCEY